MDFGVVITSHNCAEFIEKSLKSVLGQTLPPKEVVVVDDHSEDDTFRILQNWETKYPNLKVVRNETNRERCYSRNRGASLLNTEYVCFLDCDDLWLPEYLEKTKARLTAGDFKASFGLPKIFINHRGEVIRKKKPPKENFEELLFEGKVGYPSGSCFERETFLHLGGYKGQYLLREDWEIFLRFHLAGHKIAFIPSHEYAIREHGKRTSKGNKKFLEATLKVVNDYVDKIPKRYRALMLYHLAVQCFRFDQKRCGFRYLRGLLRKNWKEFLTFKRIWEVLRRIG